MRAWWGVEIPQSSDFDSIRDLRAGIHLQGAKPDFLGWDSDFGKTWKIRRIVGRAGKEQVHFVIISEGFQAQEEGAFNFHAREITDTFLNDETYAPYASGITFWKAFAPSFEHGASCDDGVNRSHSNHFGGSFPISCLNAQFGTHFNDRFVMVTRLAKVASFLKYVEGIVGGKVYPLFLMSSEKYGGAAIPYAVMTTGTPAELAVHELGHSFAGLRDEYVAPGDPCFLLQATGPNISTASDRAHIKWKEWVDTKTPVPTPDVEAYQGQVGFFQGAASCPTQLYRPSQTCKMRYHEQAFCSVCKQQVILKLFETLRPTRSDIRVQKLAGTSRGYRISVDTLRPEVVTRWWIDGKYAQESNSNRSLEIELGKGEHTVLLQAQDPTPAVRKNRCALAQTLTTQFEVQ